MSRIVSRSETWQLVYQAFQNINFSSFDYDSIKHALVDYIKLYFPEHNDIIESNEIVAILEMFAYVGEQYAYRSDVNAHETLLPVAQRKDAVLRLAKLISYNATRNVPARGLVKITSIKTTETLFDSRGRNLAGRKIQYNDPNNPNWKSQFLLVLNRVLEQPFGSVQPNERVQVDDVLFESYTLNNNQIARGVIAYSASVSGNNVQMELVPSTLTSTGPEERRPESNAHFSILYGNDGLGDQSDTTGFFIFTKQGTLQLATTQFDGITPNQTYQVSTPGINDTDVWVNQVDPDTLEILSDNLNNTERSGEWQPVDLAYAQNIIFNTNPVRNKYEIETLDQDQVRLIFGDGEFANIPSGTFQIWTRISAGLQEPIPQTSVVDKVATFTYQDQSNAVQTITITFSLVSSLQNASPTEDIEHIRRIAPAVYYTQDRMVNARDYNTFPNRDPSILKLLTVNRTFSGDSKYSAWHDPSDTYSNLKMYGDDLAIYFQHSTSSFSIFNVLTSNQVLEAVTPVLSSLDFFTLQTLNGVPVVQVRNSFTDSESTLFLNEITQRILLASATPINFFLHTGVEGPFWNLTTSNEFGQGSNDPLISVVRVQTTSSIHFDVTYHTSKLIAHSDNMSFWTVNDANRPLNYNTLTSFNDNLIILKANLNANRTKPLTQNVKLLVTQQALVEQGASNTGLVDTHRLIVVPNQIDTDVLPDSANLSHLINCNVTLTPSSAPVGIPFTLPQLAIVNSSSIPGISSDDITITSNGTLGTFSYVFTNSTNPTEMTIVDTITVTSYGDNTSVNILLKDYVYLVRRNVTQPFILAEQSTENLQYFVAQQQALVPNDEILWKRYSGRGQLNFAWFHSSPFYNIIDPAPTNIHDMFVITKGYYDAFNQYLTGKISGAPKAPTPQELRITYQYLLNNRMLSDTVVMHSGTIKPIFGFAAIPELRAILKVIKSRTTNITDNQLKASIVGAVRTFFDIGNFDFADTFYFSELSAAIHLALPLDIVSVVLVPTAANDQFGDLFEVHCREDEVFQTSISVSDIEIVQGLDAITLKQD